MLKKLIFILICILNIIFSIIYCDIKFSNEQYISFSTADNHYFRAKLTNGEICFPASSVIKTPYCAQIIYQTKNALKLKSKYDVQTYAWMSRKKSYELIQYSQNSHIKPQKIAVLYIATGKYIMFWDNFYREMEKYFLPNHDITYFLITDHMDLNVPKNVVKVYQEQQPWPYITLKRYHFFMGIEDKLKNFDYIFFLNGTLLPKQKIDEEILPSKEQGLMVAIHPGYYLGKTTNFAYERNSKSQAFVPNNEGKYYFAGGLNGGTAEMFLKMSKDIMKMTNTDLQNNIIPVWHDESMLNRYIIDYMKQDKKPLIMMPEYLIPERGFSHLNDFRPYTKFIILDKSLRGGHSYLRGEKK